MRAVMLVLLVGCDEGQTRLPPPPSAPIVAIADAAPAELLGSELATLGPAFDGLALGQAIDQSAADQWLKQRGLPATAYVRDGHLVSLAIRDPSMQRWRALMPAEATEWTTGHQHATEIITEHGRWLQFDLEVPLEQWLNTSLQSIVPTDLVAKPLDDVEHRIGAATHSGYTDGYAHTSWTDSALAGAVTTTKLSVVEMHAFTTDDHVTLHELVVDLDGSRAIYDAIDRRLTELFGPKRSRKIRLTHAPASAGVEHIELIWER